MYVSTALWYLGLCDKQWCSPNNKSLRFTQCTPDAELLTVSAYPYYLPREFSHAIVVTLYVPPSTCAKEAAERIVDHVHDLDIRSPDAINIVTSDFEQPLRDK